jgi:hypothetical protein
MSYFKSVLYLVSPLLLSMNVTSQEAIQIGESIFFNECSGKVEYLVWWSPHEEFISLGIGHFIWHSKPGPFEETFPSLLVFLEKKGVKLPHWLKADTPCPWGTREQFLEAEAQQKKEELRALLKNTTALQAEFIAERSEIALNEIQCAAPKEARDKIAKQIASLKASTRGKFALIDYINFKGTGLSPTESYKGQHWGLLQVLQGMSRGDPIQAFRESAITLLRRRVQNAPKERGEERWLPGWIARIERY